MIVLSNMWWKVIKKKLQVYTRLTAQDLHVYTIISNVIFFSAFLDIIIIITVIEVNILYFLVNVFYKQPNKSFKVDDALVKQSMNGMINSCLL